MTGYNDLVRASQPAYFGAGLNHSVTEGRDWQVDFSDFVDNDGNIIDWTGVTGVCTMYDAETGATVSTWTFTPNTTGFSLTKAAAASAGLASGGPRNGRRCRWGLVVTKSSIQVQMWGPTNSFITILHEEGQV